MTDIKRMEKPTDLVCDKCGKPMVIRWGKHGSFIGCSGYPDCTNTRELTVDLPDVDNADLSEAEGEEYCENCGRPMVLKRGQFGTFYACSGYPDCKTTRRIGEGERKPDVALDEKCPQCGNNLVMKQGRFGEFTACSNYPACRYVKQKTIGVKCPELRRGRNHRTALQTRQDVLRLQSLSGVQVRGLVQADRGKMPRVRKRIPARKWLKSGHFAQCPNAECKHRHDLAPAEASAV